jgi:hypothetical protein
MWQICKLDFYWKMGYINGYSWKIGWRCLLFLGADVEPGGEIAGQCGDHWIPPRDLECPDLDQKILRTEVVEERARWRCDLSECNKLTSWILSSPWY